MEPLRTVQLIRPFPPIRWFLRGVLWLLVLLVALLYGGAAGGWVGAFLATLLWLIIVVRVERRWAAHRPPAALRLYPDAVEVPTNLFLSETTRIPLEDLRGVEHLRLNRNREADDHLLVDTEARGYPIGAAFFPGGGHELEAIHAQLLALVEANQPAVYAAILERNARAAELRRRKTWVMWVFVVSLVAVYGLQRSWSLSPPELYERLLAMGGNFGPRVFGGEPWRLVTANFLHLNLQHLAMNATSLLILGRSTETVLGHGRQAILLLVSGLGGTLTAALLNAPNHISVGASTTVMGLFGAQAVLWWRQRRDIPFDLRGQPKALFFVATLSVLEVFAFPVDGYAHLGGALAGAAACGLVTRKRI